MFSVQKVKERESKKILFQGNIPIKRLVFFCANTLNKQKLVVLSYFFDYSTTFNLSALRVFSLCLYL